MKPPSCPPLHSNRAAIGRSGARRTNGVSSFFWGGGERRAQPLSLSPPPPLGRQPPAPSWWKAATAASGSKHPWGDAFGVPAGPGPPLGPLRRAGFAPALTQEMRFAPRVGTPGGRVVPKPHCQDPWVQVSSQTPLLGVVGRGRKAVATCDGQHQQPQGPQQAAGGGDGDVGTCTSLWGSGMWERAGVGSLCLCPHLASARAFPGAGGPFCAPQLSKTPSHLIFFFSVFQNKARLNAGGRESTQNTTSSTLPAAPPSFLILPLAGSFQPGFFPPYIFTRTPHAECWGGSSVARGRQQPRMQCLEQPPDGKSSPGYGSGEVWSAGGDAQSSPDTQPSASPCVLGSLRHVRCSYRKGFIGRYDTYSSCVGASTGFFFGFLFL